VTFLDRARASARLATAIVFGGAIALTGVAHASAASAPTLDYKAVCGAAATPGYAHCDALVRTNVHPMTESALAATPFATVSGFGPSNLQSAYNLASAAASKGAGETVAVVDAYNWSTANSDLSAYRTQFGLPACTTSNGCFKVVSQTGSTTSLPPNAPTSDDWTGEEALDVDMVSAICPLCNIDLVEATSDTDANLGTAMNEAVTLGAKFVSNSYGGPEASGDTSEDSEYYNHPGVAVTVSSGDEGYETEYPAASPDVVAVGGTSLSTSTNSRGWTESVWSTSSSEGAGSGCSAYEPKPSWQTDTGCSKRTVADVSAVADPNTGVAVYDTANSNGGWNVYGGTSVASPLIASVFALAGNPAAGSYPAQGLYSHTANLYDVTTGKTATCSPTYLCEAGTGYDGPTGLGTPNGTTAFGGSGSTGGNTVTVTNPGSQTGTVGTAVSKQITATDSASGQTLTYSASGLPNGLSISSTGLITGTPTTAGTFTPTVTATDTTGASGSASFTWTISTSGGGGGGCTAAQLIGNPGFETGTASPWTLSSGVINDDTTDEPAHSGSWDAWLDGYGTTHTDTASQAITIPSTCTTASFSFWLHIDTAETTTTTAYDTLSVQVLNSSGTVLATLATFSNLNHNTGYAQHSYSLASYIGQTVTLKFTGKEDSSLQTSFVLDDNAANVD
jgi:Putative Ig domain